MQRTDHAHEDMMVETRAFLAIGSLCSAEHVGIREEGRNKKQTRARRKANVSQVLSGLLQAELQVALRNRYCRSILQWAFAQSIRYRVGTQCC